MQSFMENCMLGSSLINLAEGETNQCPTDFFSYLVDVSE